MEQADGDRLDVGLLQLGQLPSYGSLVRSQKDVALRIHSLINLDNLFEQRFRLANG